jgi:hypothetical protein
VIANRYLRLDREEWIGPVEKRRAPSAGEALEFAHCDDPFSAALSLFDLLDEAFEVFLIFHELGWPSRRSSIVACSQC